MNLLDLLSIPLRERPDATALTWESGGAWTYHQVHAAAAAWARALAERGVERHDRVALYLGNRPETVVAVLAILRLGAVVLPINTAYRAREVEHLLADAEPTLVLTEAAQRPVLDELARQGDGGAARLADAVMDVEDLPPLEVPPSHDDPPSAGPHRTTGPHFSTGPARADDLAMLLYTSGTTGRSKGAMIRHVHLTASVAALLAAWRWRPADRLLLTLPLFHVHGLVVGLLTALAAGAAVDLHRRFDAAAIADRLTAAEGPSLFFGVPTMYVRLVDELGRRRDDCHLPAGGSATPAARLFASGSAPLAPDTFAAFRRLTGHAILERYGMTETLITLSNPYAGERRPGSVGTPLPGVSARVVDAEGRPLEDGEEGELQVAGATVCAGYWRDAEKTAAAFAPDPGDAAGPAWFRTGDQARRDPRTGTFSLLGRRHELILTGGYNVYPREVEEALEELPEVAEAAVAGLPDRDKGQVVGAWLVPAAGATPPAADELRHRLADRLARFKLPGRVFVVESLPRNALGKVQRHRLRPA